MKIDGFEGNPSIELTNKQRKGLVVHSTPAGKFARKLLRANTVHLYGVCPDDKKRMRYVKNKRISKDKYFTGWYCEECNARIDNFKALVEYCKNTKIAYD